MGLALRFDDSLETVLAADLSTPLGVQSVWRQLVDLIGRRRVEPENRAMAMLRAIRAEVPEKVRAASARALELADPPTPLVRLFALDSLPVALPVLRSARISSADWVLLLPDLSPAGRTVLRNRRDLSPLVRRALETYGAVDFVLPDERSAEDIARALLEPEEAERPEDSISRRDEPFVPPAALAEIPALPDIAPVPMMVASPPPDRPEASQGLPIGAPDAPLPAESADFSFVALAGTAASLADLPDSVTDPFQPAPAVASPAPDPVAATTFEPEAEAQPSSGMLAVGHDGPFEIAEVVARIDAFWRNRADAAPPPRPPVVTDQFRFESDAKGVIRWVDGVSRAPIVGVTLDLSAPSDTSGVDGVASGAFRRRAGFSNARMRIAGESDAAGDWLISAVPIFDSASGRFTGYRGTGRRPRSDERAEPIQPPPAPTPADSLRQLVHELRTPTNAIAGFAEMIDTQMLGPVSDPYRERAQVIRSQARELLGAIDDLDLAARIDTAALALVPGHVALRPVLAGIADDLGPLTELRGSMIALPVEDLAVSGDRRAVERLLARLLATLVSASGAGERIGIHMAAADEMVAIAIDRPQALADYPGDSVLGVDDEQEDSTLLGTGFALRLARNLARELGGSLVIEAESLTLRLPGAVSTPVGQAHQS